MKSYKPFSFSASRPLANERGGMVIVTIVIVSIVILIFSGIVTIKLTELSRQAFRINEGIRYLNVMEEMGALVARARKNGAADASCMAGATGTAVTISGRVFCLPGATVAATCITDATRRDSASASIRYCLFAATGIATVTSRDVKEGSPQDKSNVALQIIPVQGPSLIEKALGVLIGTSNVAYATCPLNRGWNVQNCLTQNDIEQGDDAAGAVQVGITGSSITQPAAFVADLVSAYGTEQTEGAALAARNTMDPWSPTTMTWSHTNELFVPNCTDATHQWVGCMQCNAVAGVTECVDIKMCPPRYTTGSAVCTDARAYRQRIMIY